MAEDLRGPLTLTITDFVAHANRTAEFAVKLENTGDRVLVDILVHGSPSNRSWGRADGRIIDMPYRDAMSGQMVFDPQGFLDADESWAQLLHAQYEVAPAGTEEDPYVFEWWVRYADNDGQRWEWRHWTCQRADGAPSDATGCSRWREYFQD